MRITTILLVVALIFFLLALLEHPQFSSVRCLALGFALLTLAQLPCAALTNPVYNSVMDALSQQITLDYYRAAYPNAPGFCGRCKQWIPAQELRQHEADHVAVFLLMRRIDHGNLFTVSTQKAHNPR